MRNEGMYDMQILLGDISRSRDDAEETPHVGLVFYGTVR